MRFFCFFLSFILLLLHLLLLHRFSFFSPVFLCAFSCVVVVSIYTHTLFSLRMRKFGLPVSLSLFGHFDIFLFAGKVRIKKNEVLDTFTFNNNLSNGMLRSKNGAIILCGTCVYLLRWRRAIAARVAIRLFQLSFSICMC